MSEPKMITAHYPVTVNLTYFKPSGKYYAKGSLTLDVDWITPGLPNMYTIFQEVRYMAINKKLPGLVSGWEGMIHVACADGFGYPGLIKVVR